jgi:hypothetical protein
VFFEDGSFGFDEFFEIAVWGWWYPSHFSIKI